MKKCPFCAEMVQPEAIKCKHCGSDLRTKQPSAAIEKRLGVLGGVLLFFACDALFGGIWALSENLIGPAILAFGIGGILMWFAWNTGAIKIACPSCKKPIKTKLKAAEISCKECGHRVRMQAAA